MGAISCSPSDILVSSRMSQHIFHLCILPPPTKKNTNAHDKSVNPCEALSLSFSPQNRVVDTDIATSLTGFTADRSDVLVRSQIVGAHFGHEARRSIRRNTATVSLHDAGEIPVTNPDEMDFLLGELSLQ